MLVLESNSVVAMFRTLESTTLVTRKSCDSRISVSTEDLWHWWLEHAGPAAIKALPNAARDVEVIEKKIPEWGELQLKCETCKLSEMKQQIFQCVH